MRWRGATSRRRLWTTWLGAVAALVLVLAAPAASQYPPSDTQMTASDTSPGAGDEVQVAGDGFMPGSTVSIYFESTPVLLATTLVDQHGHFSVRVRIPANATPGHHLLRAKGIGTDGLPRELTIPIFVTARPAAREPASDASGVWGGVRTAASLVAALALAVAAVASVLRWRGARTQRLSPPPAGRAWADPTNPSGTGTRERWGLGGRWEGRVDREPDAPRPTRGRRRIRRR